MRTVLRSRIGYLKLMRSLPNPHALAVIIENPNVTM
jgi:hypothetical protein